MIVILSAVPFGVGHSRSLFYISYGALHFYPSFQPSASVNLLLGPLLFFYLMDLFPLSSNVVLSHYSLYSTILHSVKHFPFYFGQHLSVTCNNFILHLKLLHPFRPALILSFPLDQDFHCFAQLILNKASTGVISSIQTCGDNYIKCRYRNYVKFIFSLLDFMKFGKPLLLIFGSCS